MMAMSDAKLLEDISARLLKVEEEVRDLLQTVGEMLPKEMQGELYGPEADHTEDRQARAALGAEKRPGRPARI